MRKRITIKTKSTQLVSTTILREGNGELATSIKKFKQKVRETPMKLSKAQALIALIALLF